MTSRTGFPRWWGAACGLLAAAAAMGIGQLFAGFTVPAASPVVAVGDAAIDRTPLAVKDWATSTFGTADKTVLLGGVLVVVFLYSVVVGVLAMRRLALGFLGLAIFAGIGLAAALTRHDATGSYVVPTLFGAVAGALVLWWLVGDGAPGGRGGPGGARRAGTAAPTGCRRSPPGRGGRGAGATLARRTAGRLPPASDSAGRRPHWVTGSAGDGDDDGSLGWVAAGRGRPPPSRPRAGADSGTGRTGGTGPGSPGRPEPGGPRPPARRQFLVAAGVGVAAAAIGEFGGRSLATRKNVSAARQALRFPRAAVPAPPLPAGVNLPVPGSPRSSRPTASSTASTPPSSSPRWTPRTGGCASTAWSAARSSSPSTSCCAGR